MAASVQPDGNDSMHPAASTDVVRRKQNSPVRGPVITQQGKQALAMAHTCEYSWVGAFMWRAQTLQWLATLPHEEASHEASCSEGHYLPSRPRSMKVLHTRQNPNPSHTGCTLCHHATDAQRKGCTMHSNGAIQGFKT